MINSECKHPSICAPTQKRSRIGGKQYQYDIYFEVRHSAAAEKFKAHMAPAMPVSPHEYR